MRLLLDTHIALWAITDDPRLAVAARALILEPANTLFVSAASVWEIAIKHALGQGRADAMPIGGKEARAYFAQAGFESLAISDTHAAALDALDPHHSDPFDRLLIAQAQVEPMHLITADRKLAAYGAMVQVV